MPVYNVGNYLINTLESVIKQTSQDFELLVINDGSTDQSLSLAENILQQSYINYQVFSHPNQGVGYTRNFGIKHAKGKYIYFLDGDDIIEKNAIEILMSFMKNDFDIILFGFRHNNKISIMAPEFTNQPLLGKEIIKLFCLGKVDIHMCSFIVKKSVLEKNRIVFAEQAKYGEDHEFIVKTLFHSTRGIIMQDILFNYISRESSAVNTFSYHRLDSLESANRILFYIKEKDSESVLSPYMSLYLLGKYRYNLYCAVQYNVNNDLKDKLLQQIRIFSQKSMSLKLIEEVSLVENFKNFIKIILIRDLTYPYYNYLNIKKNIKSYLNR